jgi:hypothetical protein
MCGELDPFTFLVVVFDIFVYFVEEFMKRNDIAALDVPMGVLHCHVVSRSLHKRESDPLLFAKAQLLFIGKS